MHIEADQSDVSPKVVLTGRNNIKDQKRTLLNRHHLISIHQMLCPLEQPLAESALEGLSAFVVYKPRILDPLSFCTKMFTLLKRYGKTNESSRLELLEATRARCFGVARKILEQKPDCIKEVTPETRETALHIAVRNGDLKMVEVLLGHLRGKFYYSNVIDMIDAGGNTVLHLAVARKQLKTIQMLLENGPADRLMLSVNAKNHGGFRALDILDVLPESGEVDMKIEKTLRRAGALSAKDLAIRNKDETKLIEHKFDRNKQEVLIEFDESVLPPRSEALANRNSVVLIVATLIATMTFHAELNPPTIIPYNVLKEEEAFWNHLFVLFNSVAFFTAVASITVLLTHELAVKPWLHISVFSAIGAYLCTVMAVSPQEVVTVIFMGILVFVGAVGKVLKVHKKMVHNIKRECARIHPI